MAGKMRIRIVCLCLIAAIASIDANARKGGHTKKVVEVQDEADGCYHGPDKYRCHNFTGPYLRYNPSLENVNNIYIEGNFSELIIDTQFGKLESLSISPHSFLPNFNFSTYNDLPSLKSFTLVRANIGRIRTDGVGNLRNLTNIVIHSSAIGSIDAPGFNTFPSLEVLGFYQSNVSRTFDFSVIPTNLIGLQLDSIQANEIPCETLKRVSVLQSLTINKFNGTEIDFACMSPTLIHLTVSDCRNARFLNLGAIKHFSSLESLGLSYNNLETFNISMLPSNITSLLIQKTYTLSSVTCSKTDHLTKLKYITLSHNKLTEFPCLPDSAKIIYLDNNQISTIACADLQRLNSSHLLLASNRLEEFDFDCLKYDRMFEIDLSYNQITTLNLKPLLRLSRLKVKLNGNIINCTCSLLADYFEIRQLEGNHFRYQCTTFDKCITCNPNSRLQGYPLSSNSLSTIKAFDYQHVGCLLTHTSVSKSEGVDLENGCIYDNVYNTVPTVECQNYSSNALSDLRTYHPNFVNLESLDVRGDFSSLAVEGGYENLTLIKLESQNMRTFNFSAVDKFPKLAILDLSNSGIETIYTTEIKTEIRVLNLSNNHITSLNSAKATFKNFDLMKELLLTHNNLNSFDMNVLPVFSMLRLDLSRNNISVVSFRDVAQSDIRVFDLSYNQLTTFSLKYPNGTLKYMVEELLLSHNKFNYFDINGLPKEARKLDLSHNNISSVDFCNGTNYLHTIDLSWNALTHFNLDDLWLGQLQQLLLSHNKILSINAGSGMVALYRLNLNIKNNLIKCDCDFLTVYTTVLTELMTCSAAEECFTCREDSHLANYPWYNLTQLNYFKNTEKDCQAPENGQTIIRASIMTVFVSFAFMFLTQ